MQLCNDWGVCSVSAGLQTYTRILTTYMCIIKWSVKVTQVPHFPKDNHHQLHQQSVTEESSWTVTVHPEVFPVFKLYAVNMKIQPLYIRLPLTRLTRHSLSTSGNWTHDGTYDGGSDYSKRTCQTLFNNRMQVSNDAFLIRCLLWWHGFCKKKKKRNQR